ncbi:MAG: S1/P1 nuclease [Alistipes sp.]|nr:S1/P1 nuclease [Alistipes sp.]
MKRFTLFAIALLALTANALAFTKFGHQTIAALAEKHMTDKAKSEVRNILKEDMVTSSVWLNTLRENEATAYTKEWHIFSLDKNHKSTTSAENDGTVQLERAISVLRNRANESDSLVVASLRTVIHLVGDMHCLSHIRIDGIEETKGFEFPVSNEATGKAHRVKMRSWNYIWQHMFLKRYTIFSPQYYADDIDIYANAKKAEYEKGAPRFWVENGGEDVVRALELFNTGEDVLNQTVLSHEYNHTKTMAKAGYRLAALLNDIFK